MDKDLIDIENEQILGDNPPHNYLAFAIICTVVCFAPVGIFALFYSLRVNQYCEEKNYSKARRASMLTRIICVWTIIAGIIFWLGILSGAFYNIFGGNFRFIKY